MIEEPLTDAHGIAHDYGITQVPSMEDGAVSTVVTDIEDVVAAIDEAYEVHLEIKSSYSADPTYC